MYQSINVALDWSDFVLQQLSDEGFLQENITISVAGSIASEILVEGLVLGIDVLNKGDRVGSVFARVSLVGSDQSQDGEQETILVLADPFFLPLRKESPKFSVNLKVYFKWLKEYYKVVKKEQEKEKQTMALESYKNLVEELLPGV